MPIKTVEMVSFRNHEHNRFEFGERINLIWGENGSGKTSILEAVYILSLGRSFRTRQLDRAIQTGADNLYIEGTFETNGAEKRITFGMSRNGRRKLTLNGKKRVGTKALIGENPVVLLSPEEQTITTGGPLNRRAYFDRIFSTVSRSYLEALSAYTKALRQRNVVLKNNPGKRKDVEVWDETLVGYGVQVWNERKALMKVYVECLSGVLVSLKRATAQLRVEWKPKGTTDEDGYRRQLVGAYSKDQRLGWTSVGPHRDDISLVFNGKALKGFGSQGEHKLSLVLLKLAEFALIHNRTGILPILLLDDLFAKLDVSRGEAVMALLDWEAQTLITNTDLLNIQRFGFETDTCSIKTFHLVR